MCTRKELKARAKAAFKANYWKCVLVTLIVMLLSSCFSVARSVSNEYIRLDPIQKEYPLEIAEQLKGRGETLWERAGCEVKVRKLRIVARLSSTLAGRVALWSTSLVIGLLSLLVLNPLIVGCRRFFLQNIRGDGNLKHLGAGFSGEWGNVVLTMFLQGLFTLMWGLLLVVPGIVKAYSYRLTPYLLLEHPGLSGTKAITLSQRMMSGHKREAFLLDLSFIGWFLLGLLTLDISGIFYARPYYYSADAELYESIRACSDVELSLDDD